MCSSRIFNFRILYINWLKPKINWAILLLLNWQIWVVQARSSSTSWGWRLKVIYCNTGSKMTWLTKFSALIHCSQATSPSSWSQPWWTKRNSHCILQQWAAWLNCTDFLSLQVNSYRQTRAQVNQQWPDRAWFPQWSEWEIRISPICPICMQRASKCEHKTTSLDLMLISRRWFLLKSKRLKPYTNELTTKILRN